MPDAEHSATPMLDVSGLLKAECYDHPVNQLELLETHISWVILTGKFVYKIKKPVNLGFLDFSSLAKRRYFCEEELRLNRRLAPHIYLAVIPVRGSRQQPCFNGDAEIIDYAVKMRQFPQEAQLDRMLLHNQLQTNYLDSIAECIAQFHLEIALAPETSEYGEPLNVWQPVAENFQQILEHEKDADVAERLDTLYKWSEQCFARLKPELRQRKVEGFIRECHGDLHLRNIAWFDDKPVIFDCIEFNPNLRWIDVISDLTFLFMDLVDRGQGNRAYRLLNRYLATAGDYAGLTLLPFYFVYRALVRAKVARIRLSQSDVSDKEIPLIKQEYIGYLQLAVNFIHRPKPILMITWGLSGSGKSTISSGLLEQMPAIRLRSDVERKRLAGIDATTHASAAVAEGIYTSEMSRRTYEYLLQQTDRILQAGFSVIVDAAFLDAGLRVHFRNLARQLDLPFVILQCDARVSILRERIRQRKDDASDANLAILEHQLHQEHALSNEELSHSVLIDTEQQIDMSQLCRRIHERVTEIGA